ncbi:hypothetical protein, partial [Dubosiella newyorkensis]
GNPSFSDYNKVSSQKGNPMQKNQIYVIALVDVILLIAFAVQMYRSPSWLNGAILVVVGINLIQVKGMYDKAKQKEEKNKL